MWLLLGFHAATRSVQSTPADSSRKRVLQYIEKERQFTDRTEDNPRTLKLLATVHLHMCFRQIKNITDYPHAFLKKRWGYCNRLRPSVRPSLRLSVRLSVRPSRYLLLNHWTKFNQIWCVGCSHEWGVQRHIFFLPRPLGPWGGAKRSNIIKCH